MIEKKQAPKRKGGSPKIEFALDNEPLSTSPIKTAPPNAPKQEIAKSRGVGEPAAEKIKMKAEEVSPRFATLDQPTLPDLPRSDRARLQMQSPNRLYFYWGVGGNPYQKLRSAVGPAADAYTLVVRLLDLHRGGVQLHPTEPEGSRWFDVESGISYRAEVGFYAPNRPFVRILFSNSVNTPRRAPSSRPASESAWKVSATEFVGVLSASGYGKDAFDVAIAGDEPLVADAATQSAWSELVAGVGAESIGFDYSELRYALFAIASGVRIEELRARIGPRMFALVVENAPRLLPEAVAGALKKHFAETAEESERLPSASVFGASLINFPPRPKWRPGFPEMESRPFGSHSPLSRSRT